MPDEDGHPNCMFLVNTCGHITGGEEEFQHQDRTVRSYSTLLCRLLRVEALDGDLQGARWQNFWYLGARSMFIGHSYPLMLEMPRSGHDQNGLPFLTQRCVFIAHSCSSTETGRLPELCRYSVDGPPTMGVYLKSCEEEQHDNLVWLVSSLCNRDEWQ